MADSPGTTGPGEPDIVKAKRAFASPAPKCIDCGTQTEIHDDGFDAFWWCPKCEQVPGSGYFGG